MTLPRRFLLSGRGPNRFVEAEDTLDLADVLMMELECEPALALKLAAEAWQNKRVTHGLVALEPK